MADALAAESARVAEVVGALPGSSFLLGTRCPPWDVKALLGHMWRDVDRVTVCLAKPAPDAVDRDAVSYFRGFDPVAAAPGISKRAEGVAARFATALARSFDERWREAVEAARIQDSSRVVRTIGPSMLFADYLATRVLEMAVHGLDLADALGREPWLTPDGATVTREILVGLIGSEPPAALGWDERTLIETGTGRRALAEGERATLGDRAGVFPLLS